MVRRIASAQEDETDDACDLDDTERTGDCMLRKWLAGTLAILMLLFMNGVALAEEQIVSVDAVLLSGMTGTVETWYGDESRIPFAAATLVEVVLTGNNNYAMTAFRALEMDRVYIARQSTTVVMFFWAEDMLLMTVFFPMDGEMYLLHTGINTPTDWEIVRQMDKHVSDGDLLSYYHLSGMEVWQAYSLIVEALGN